MNSRFLFILAAIIATISAQTYYWMNSNGVGSYFIVNKACIRVSNKNYVAMSIPKTEFTKSGQTLESFRLNYDIDLASVYYISEGSDLPIVSRIDTNSGIFYGTNNILLDTTTSNQNVIVNQYVEKPMVGFESGEFSIDTILRNPSRNLIVKGYKMFLFPNNATLFSANYDIKSIGAMSNLTLKINTPCAYLHALTAITFEFPTANTNLTTGYFTNPLSYINSFNCPVYIDGVRPPGIVCNVTNGTLTLTNVFSSNRLNPNFTMVVPNMTAYAPFLGEPVMKFHFDETRSAPYLFQSLNATLNPYTFYHIDRKFSPSVINKPNFQINTTIIGIGIKVPLNAGTTVRFTLIDDFFGLQLPKIVVMSRFNGAVETGVPTKSASGYTYKMTKDYLFDKGFIFSIQSPMSPPVNKVYYLRLSVYSKAGLLIGSESVYAMSFKAS